ncbi:unnamed protein product [Leuciscus chuanchicus]
MRNIFFLFGALSLVDDVFGVAVTVMEGDSVTLKPHTVIPEGEGDSAQWKFGELIIARINKAKGRFSTSEGDNVGFKGCLKLDNQNGSLTITNIRTDHTGLYTLKISGTTETSETFSVTVSGKMKPVSVKEGESITLDTRLIGIKAYDLIMWKFKDQIIAELNKGTNPFSTPDTSDERFKDRLQLGQTTVSLIISDSRITDSGDYSLHMISSSHTTQRTISVTVSDKETPDPGLSPGVVAGIISGVVVALLLVFAAVLAAGVIYHRREISELQRRLDDAEKNETDDSLNLRES